jgi:hypothetical protein
VRRLAQQRQRVASCHWHRPLHRRGGRSSRDFLNPACITDPCALLGGEYTERGLCYGGGRIQAEKLAQARAIARLNARGVCGDSDAFFGITPSAACECFRQPTGSLLDDLKDLGG